MRIGLTGATGFLGRYIAADLTGSGHQVRAWYRPTSDRGGFESAAGPLEWVPGGLNVPASNEALVEGCDAVVHAALDRPGRGFRDAEVDVAEFIERNVVGTIRLIEAARMAGVGRFVFISTCSVHEVILGDRPLDETHPTWSNNHYGAHKAAIECFVQSYGLGHGYPICALRPTGIYGLDRPARDSKWYALVRSIAMGEEVSCHRGGKEVHAADVARAVALLLGADAATIAGQSYACYDRYISEYEVATIARDLAGGTARIHGEAPTPKHQIVTDKIRALGMEFGGRPRLERTVAELLAAVR